MTYVQAEDFTELQWAAAVIALDFLNRPDLGRSKCYTTERGVSVLASVSRDTARIALRKLWIVGLLHRQPPSGSWPAQYMPRIIRDGKHKKLTPRAPSARAVIS